MAVHSKPTLDKFKRILEERYETLLKELDGIPAINYKNNYIHGNDWEDRDREYEKQQQDEYGKLNRTINALNLRLAADDFINVLKEVKKLK